MDEEWRDIPSWEGLYEVSNTGIVRSHKRMTRTGLRGGGTLYQYVRYDGYAEVYLYRASVRTARRVHHLVLEAFIGPCPEGQEALHGPGGKLDNSQANLTWGTRAQNMGEDRVRDHQSNRGEHHGLTTLTWEQVCEIRALLGKIPQNVLAARYGVSKQTITNIKTGHTWAHPPEDW